MKLKLFLSIFATLLFFCGTSFADNTVPGDVIVIFYNPSPDIPVTMETLSKDSGVHYEYINSVAEELEAKVSLIYDTLSIDSNTIMALFHTDTRSAIDLWFDLRMRDDVKGASLNHIQKISPRKGKGR